MCYYVRSFFCKIFVIALIVCVCGALCSCENFSNKEDPDLSQKDEWDKDYLPVYGGYYVYKLFYTYEEALAYYEKLADKGMTLYQQAGFNYSDEYLGVVYCFEGAVSRETYEARADKNFEDLKFESQIIRLNIFLYYKGMNSDSYNTLTHRLTNQNLCLDVPFDAMCETTMVPWFDLSKYGNEIDTEKLAIEIFDQDDFIYRYDIWYESEIFMSFHSIVPIEPQFLEKIKSSLVIFEGETIKKSW